MRRSCSDETTSSSDSCDLSSSSDDSVCQCDAHSSSASSDSDSVGHCRSREYVCRGPSSFGPGFRHPHQTQPQRQSPKHSAPSSRRTSFQKVGGTQRHRLRSGHRDSRTSGKDECARDRKRKATWGSVDANHPVNNSTQEYRCLKKEGSNKFTCVIVEKPKVPKSIISWTDSSARDCSLNMRGNAGADDPKDAKSPSPSKEQCLQKEVNIKKEPVSSSDSISAKDPCPQKKESSPKKDPCIKKEVSGHRGRSPNKNDCAAQSICSRGSSCSKSSICKNGNNFEPKESYCSEANTNKGSDVGGAVKGNETSDAKNNLCNLKCGVPSNDKSTDPCKMKRSDSPNTKSSDVCKAKSKEVCKTWGSACKAKSNEVCKAKSNNVCKAKSSTSTTKSSGSCDAKRTNSCCAKHSRSCTKCNKKTSSNAKDPCNTQKNHEVSKSCRINVCHSDSQGNVCYAASKKVSESAKNFPECEKGSQTNLCKQARRNSCKRDCPTKPSDHEVKKSKPDPCSKPQVCSAKPVCGKDIKKAVADKASQTMIRCSTKKRPDERRCSRNSSGTQGSERQSDKKRDVCSKRAASVSPKRSADKYSISEPGCSLACKESFMPTRNDPCAEIARTSCSMKSDDLKSVESEASCICECGDPTCDVTIRPRSRRPKRSLLKKIFCKRRRTPRDRCDRNEDKERRKREKQCEKERKCREKAERKARKAREKACKKRRKELEKARKRGEKQRKKCECEIAKACKKLERVSSKCERKTSKYQRDVKCKEEVCMKSCVSSSSSEDSNHC
nr:PREDICTED: axoneme-associated protein mst101(2)-like [Bemisia tabaci]